MIGNFHRDLVTKLKLIVAVYYCHRSSPSVTLTVFIYNVKLTYCIVFHWYVVYGKVVFYSLCFLLYSVYIDDLIVKLTKANLGCCIGNVNFCCLFFADDIVLLSGSLYKPLGNFRAQAREQSSLEAPHCNSYSMRLSLNYFGVLFLVASICRFVFFLRLGWSDSYNLNAL